MSVKGHRVPIVPDSAYTVTDRVVYPVIKTTLRPVTPTSVREDGVPSFVWALADGEKKIFVQVRKFFESQD